MEVFVIAFLCVLILAMTGFWMYHTQSLVNKIMSKNYNEYAQNQSILKKKDRKPKRQQEFPLDAREDLNYLGFQN